jgi:hypothetical protein
VRKPIRTIWKICAAIAAMFVAGSLLVVALSTTSTTTRTYTTPIREIVASTERGAIAITAVPGAHLVTVASREKKVIWGPVVTERLTNGILTLTATCPLSAFISCSSDFVITAPPGIAVRGTAQRGLFAVNGMAGTVYSNSENGAFRYRGASPSITAYSLEGVIDAVSTAPPNFVHLRSETANVTLTVPPGVYNTVVTSGTGIAHIDGITPHPHSHRSLTVSSGAGSATLQAK